MPFYRVSLGGKSGGLATWDMSSVLKGWPDFLSINSYQDDGDEPVEKNSLQIGMMGLSRVYAYKIYKSALWCNP